MNKMRIKNIGKKIQVNNRHLSFMPKDAVKNIPFKKWFDNSIVIDKSGFPLVVYHGTASKINEFKYDFAGIGHQQYGSGFYFTTDKTEAKGYESRTPSEVQIKGEIDNPNTISAYLRITNPLYVNTPNKATRKQIHQLITASPQYEDALWNYGDWQTEGKSVVTNEAVNTYLDGGGDTLLDLINVIGNDFYKGEEGALLKNVNKVFGYDGVQVDFSDKKYYVAWFPTQIKSIDNVGAFDDNNPNILFKKGGELRFYSNCVGYPVLSDLEHIIDNEKEIKRSSFIANVSKDDRLMLEQQLGYNKNFTIDKDWHVKYFKSKDEDGNTVYFMRHSAIEYVFSKKGNGMECDYEPFKDGGIIDKPTIIKIKDFETEEGKFSIYDISKDVRGRVNLFTVFKDKNGYIIRNSFVPTELQRKGIASDFYKQMNIESLKKTGKPLRSTQPRTLVNGEVVHELSKDGITLWDSFVRAGIAEKVSEKNYRFYPKINYKVGGKMVIKKSNLTPEQQKLVRTPEFKKWFGDWEKDPKNSSKVVDENGEPRIVFHGSYSNFNVFDRNKLSPIYDEKSKQFHTTGGFFFSNDFGISSSYKNRRPNKYTNRWAWYMSYIHSHKVKPYFLNLKNPLIIDGKGKNWDKIKSDKDWYYSTDDISYQTYKAGKHDGVIFYDIYDTADANKFLNKSDSYVAFNSNQIKLADGTNKTFDINNLDIRYKDGGKINGSKFEIIPNVQPIKTYPIADVKEFIKKNHVMLNEFLEFASSIFSGIGLSANQVSLNGKRLQYRFFAINNDSNWKLIINPFIHEYIGIRTEIKEQCLSWKCKDIVVKRTPKVKVSYWDIFGNKHEGEIYSGHEAEIWQHELDHLNGTHQDVTHMPLVQDAVCNLIGGNL